MYRVAKALWTRSASSFSQYAAAGSSSGGGASAAVPASSIARAAPSPSLLSAPALVVAAGGSTVRTVRTGSPAGTWWPRQGVKPVETRGGMTGAAGRRMFPMA